MTIHNFRDELAFSQQAHQEPFWEAVYRAAFPSFAGMMANQNDNDAQRSGVDRIVLLGNGLTLRIDEKARRKYRPDVLLEYTSNDRTQAPGWMQKDLAIDHLAYGFLETSTALLFPWPQLQRAWVLNRREWYRAARDERDGFRLIAARNPTYNTLSIAVPTTVLQAAIADAIVITVDPTVATSVA